MACFTPENNAYCLPNVNAFLDTSRGNKERVFNAPSVFRVCFLQKTLTMALNKLLICVKPYFSLFSPWKNFICFQTVALSLHSLNEVVFKGISSLLLIEASYFIFAWVLIALLDKGLSPSVVDA